MEAEQQKFYVHTYSRPVGPFFCSVNKDIPDHLTKLLKTVLSTTDDSIFVVLYPPTDSSTVCDEQNHVDVYEIPLERNESVSLDGVKRLLSDKYGRDEALSVWRRARDSECKCRI